MAMFPNFNELVAYQIRVVELTFMERRRRSMTDHGQALFGILPTGAAELRERDAEQNVDESVSMHRFVSSAVVPLKDAVPQTG